VSLFLPFHNQGLINTLSKKKILMYTPSNFNETMRIWIFFNFSLLIFINFYISTINQFLLFFFFFFFFQIPIISSFYNLGLIRGWTFVLNVCIIRPGWSTPYVILLCYVLSPAIFISPVIFHINLIDMFKFFYIF
jgi:hypothetical protein